MFVMTGGLLQGIMCLLGSCMHIRQRYYVFVMTGGLLQSIMCLLVIKKVFIFRSSAKSKYQAMAYIACVI